MNKEKNSKCPVCGEPMNLFVPFCPRCSFEVHILPDGTPENIRKMEEERVRVAKNAYAQHAAAANENTSLAESNKRLTEEISRLDKEKKELQNRTVHIKDLAAKNDKEIAVLTIPASEVKKELDAANKKIGEKNCALDGLNKKISQLESAAKIVEAQRKDLIEKLNKANDSLSKEIAEHNKTKKLRGQQKAEKNNQSSPIPPKDKPQPRPVTGQQQGKPVGKVIFSCRGTRREQTIYQGKNVYCMPEGFKGPHDVGLFRVEEKDGNFRLYDICGQTKKSNGSIIGSAGASIKADSVFWCYDVVIGFDLPDINLDKFFI